ncbi:MAG: FecR domain-containing protein, partial [bacterium]
GSMQRELNRGHSSSFSFIPTKILRQGWVYACAVPALVALLLVVYLSYADSSVIEVRFPSDTGSNGVSSVWKFRLERGFFVTVPGVSVAEIHLVDGSKVVCKSGTEIAINFGAYRQIRINSGSITVNTASNPNLPMMVETPLGIVEAVGTVFRVEVNR